MRVAAVIVTYKPDWQRVEDLIDQISPSMDPIVVVDNTNRTDVAQPPQKLCSLASHHLFIHVGENIGIAAAQNRGLERLNEHCNDTCLDYVLFLDQDSVPDGEMITRLVNHFHDLTENGHRVAAVGPEIVRDSIAKNTPCKNDQDRYSEAKTLISSGMLVSREALDAVGPFDEELFIDHVETDWLFRARKQGFQVFQAHDAWLQHSLGERTLTFRLHRKFQVALHRPERYVYQIRNLIWLLRRRTIPIGWGLSRLVKTLAVAILCLVIQRNKRLFLQSIAQGLHAGFVKGI